MSILRKDGSYTVYVIQHFSHSADDWHYSSFDYFGTPDGFGASGGCWQITGVHGVFSQEKGIAGLQWLSSRHKETTFRLVELSLSQVTEVICVLEGSKS